MSDQKLREVSKSEMNGNIKEIDDGVDLTRFSIDSGRPLPSIDDDRSSQSSSMTEQSTIYSFASFDKLIDICQNNIKHFDRDDSEIGQRFLHEFRNIIVCVTMARNYVTKYMSFVHEYDFDANIQANGYRSIVKSNQAAIYHTIKICKQVSQKRSSMLFWKSTYVKEVEACSQLLNSMCCYLEEILKIREKSKPGTLFASGDHKASGFFYTSSKIEQLPFYGRCIGFQYCKSIKAIMKHLGVSITGFSEMYFNSSSNRIVKATSTMFSGSKYVWNPELRAERYLNVTRYGGTEFCKAFLALAEGDLVYQACKMVAPSVAVNRLIKIHPESFEMENVVTPNKMVQIPVPSSHLPTGPISARLLSYERRVGMIGEQNKKHIHPESKSLIIHCHGGGFVSMSSRSHEVYLREWAVQLHVPILSIDYSLSPKAPYPRALEEVYYVYCWAIKNARSLGTTAEQIIVTGDSAGALLSLTLALKIIKQQIRRPDGVLLLYCPTNLGFTPTPARYLCLMDVLLPFGILMACLKAYVHPDPDEYDAMYDKKKKQEEIVVERAMRKSSMQMNGTKSHVSAMLSVISENQDEDEMNEAPTPMEDNSMWEDIQQYLNEHPNSKRSISDDAYDSVVSGSPHSSSVTDMDEMFDIMNLDFNANSTNQRHSSITFPNIDMGLPIPPSGRGSITQSSEQDVLNALNRTTINRKCLKSLMSRNPADDFLFDVPKDPFIVAYLASDEALKQLPIVKIMTSDMDPFLDDCIEMAKRLRGLGVPTSLDVVTGLPHGYLNFVQVSKDARDANQLCIARLAEVLDIKLNEKS